jgi:hypothetical protein
LQEFLGALAERPRTRETGILGRKMPQSAPHVARKVPVFLAEMAVAKMCRRRNGG